MQTRSKRRSKQEIQHQPAKKTPKRKLNQNRLPINEKLYSTKLSIPMLQNQTENQAERSNDISNDEKLNEQLSKLYKDITAAPSYSAKITDFLRKHDVHGVYRRIVKKKFPRRKVIARFPFDVFMADLIEYPQYKHVNNGYCFILIMIDCFTKMLYAAPMKKKNKEWTSEAFESIFKNFDEYPVNLVTDGGLEFFNSAVQKVFDTYGINHYKTPTRTKWKASVAERVIRTLKSRLEKYFKVSGKRRWIDTLDQFVLNYNSVPHSSHGLAPQDVSSENREYVYKKLYPLRNLTIACKLKVGDKVRKIREKSDFEKGYTEKWSEEIYTITEQRQSQAVCWYKISNLKGETIPGIFYYYQLNLVSRNDYQLERKSAQR